MEQYNNKQLKKSTFDGIFWKLSERVCAQLVSMIVSIILARILVPDDYSVVGIVFIFFSFCNVIVTSGLNTSLIQKKDADMLDYSTVLYTTLGISAVLYAVMFFAADWIAQVYQKELLVPIIRVMSVTFFINSVKSVLSAYTSSHLQFKKFFFSTIIGTVISAVVGISMAYAGCGAWALVAQEMINSFIDTLILLYSVRMKLQWAFSLKRLKHLFGYGWKIFVSSLVSVIYTQLNPLIVGLKFTAADLAFYNRGSSFPNLINTSVSDTLSSVLFPVMAKVQDDRENVLNMTRRYIKLSTYVIFPMMMGMFSVSENFVRVVLTEKWLAAVPYIQIFSLAYMFDMIMIGNLQAIKAIGRSDLVLKMEILKKSIYFVVIFLFVFTAPSPEILAVSSLVCTLVALVINTYPNRKLIDYHYQYQIMDVFPNLLITVLMGLCVLAVGRFPFSVVPLLAIQIFAGVVSYIGLSILFRNDNFFYLLDFLKAYLKKEV